MKSQRVGPVHMLNSCPSPQSENSVCNWVKAVVYLHVTADVNQENIVYITTFFNLTVMVN